MRTVGIKLADGSFYPIMEEGSAQQKKLDLTTAHNNQTCVMVDLYRSKTCSMEDAEYIDTLKIDNLLAHPNGEPNISFSVGLDENGELTAKIEDPETGAKSNSAITLVSRTIEERLSPDDYTIEPSVLDDNGDAIPTETENNHTATKVAAGALAGAGLLAAAAAIKNKEENNTETGTLENDFNLGNPDFNNEEIDISENIETPDDETFVTDVGLPTENTLDNTEVNLNTDETISDTSDFDIPDENTDSIAENAGFEDSDFNIPEENEDITLQDNPDDILNNDTLSDMDNFDIPEESFSDSEITLENKNNNTFENTEVSSTEEIPTDILSFDIPEENTDSVSENIEFEDSSFDIPDTQIEEKNDIFNDDIPDETVFDIPEETNEINNSEDNSFDIPDSSYNSDINDDNDIFGDYSSDDSIPAGNGLSFTGLYDKETEMGESATHEEDDVKKKTKVPVIICTICACICILATILILFIIPSKYNLLKKNNNEKQKTEEVKEVPAPVIEETKKEPEIIVPEAKEDEIVIIEQAEIVTPLPPPVIEEKPKDITYKIKWGDTLWDIADTYYKNPWRYKKIANYNNIKNPDYIISGTTILIPAE